MLRQKIKESGFAAAAMRLVLLIAVSACCVFTASFAFIPNDFSVRASDAHKLSVSLPFVTISTDEAVSVYNDNAKSTSYGAQAKIMGLAVKDVTVNVYDDNLRLYPGGGTFGVRLQTKGVVVVGISEVATEQGKATPALDAGLLVGDVITEIGGKAVNTVDEVTKLIAECEGKSVEMTVLRKETTVTLTISRPKAPTTVFTGRGFGFGTERPELEPSPM